MKTMLAARMYGKGDIRVEEVSIPTIDENEVLLKVQSAAICGTDLRMYANGYKDIGPDNPRILGHEFAGVIDEVGKKVSKKYKKGMTVAVAPNMGCGTCKFCTAGKVHLCEDFFQAPGINIDGGFAEYVRIPEQAVRQGNIIPLDSRVSTEEAALNEPLSCVYNGFLKVGINPGDNVLIIGAGPIGLMHAKLAKMAGAAKVMINDLSEERLKICTEVDSFFMAIKSENLKDDIMTITNQRGVDVCITACPAPSAQQIALELTAVEGRISFFGGLPKDREIVGINTNLIHYKELLITGSTKANASMFSKTLHFIAEGLVDVKGLISEKYDLRDIHEAFKTAKSATGLKNVIIFE